MIKLANESKSLYLVASMIAPKENDFSKTVLCPFYMVRVCHTESDANMEYHIPVAGNPYKIPVLRRCRKCGISSGPGVSPKPGGDLTWFSATSGQLGFFFQNSNRVYAFRLLWCAKATNCRRQELLPRPCEICHPHEARLNANSSPSSCLEGTCFLAGRQNALTS